MKYKSLTIFCMLSLSLVLSCCGNSPSGNTGADPSPSAGQEPAAAVPSSDPQPDAGSVPDDPKDSASDSDLSAGPQEILNWEGLTVTAGSWDPSQLTLQISAENTGSRPVTLQAAFCSVNDYMQTPDFSLNVDAQSSAEGVMTFRQEDFSVSGISQAETIAFTPVVLDGTDYSILHTSSPAVIATGLSAGEQPDIQGETLYQQDGIRILYLGQGDNSQWGMDFLLYVENTSGRDLAFETENCQINGSPMDPLFSSVVSDGKKSVTALSVFSEELQENQITEPLSLTFDMKLLDPQTYETVEVLQQLSPRLSS